MADFKKIRIMISSRCSSRVADGEQQVSMTEVRARLHDRLCDEPLLGEALFEVWISDNAPDQSQGDLDTAWNRSLEEVRKADIVLALYTGEAGWAPKSGEIGICHAEFQEVWNNGPARLKVVRVLEVKFSGKKSAAEKKADKVFQDYFQTLNPTSPEARNADDIVARSLEALREAVASLVKLGGREARKGRFAYGTALDWSRLDFSTRKQAMEEALGEALRDLGANPLPSIAGGWDWPLAGESLLTIVHGLPAAFGVAAARELVGQPFLKDHRYVPGGVTPSLAGPLHLVACLKTVSESQAMRQLGFPDATIVAAPFGIYVADKVQKIQMVFLANCRDATTTRHALTRLVEWLDSTGEEVNLVSRARGRRRIVDAVKLALDEGGQ
jgi:hypothetical protein